MTAAAALVLGRVLATEVFPSDLRSLAPIRGFVEKWGKEVGLDAEQRYGMKLAVDEACSNAIEHPEEKSDLTLWAWQRGDRFTVDVWHAGVFRVQMGRERVRRGMGLPLMVACVDEVAFAWLPEGGTRVSLSTSVRHSVPPHPPAE